jgi:hypothetical protein
MVYESRKAQNRMHFHFHSAIFHLLLFFPSSQSSLLSLLFSPSFTNHGLYPGGSPNGRNSVLNRSQNASCPRTPLLALLALRSRAPSCNTSTRQRHRRRRRARRTPGRSCRRLFRPLPVGDDTAVLVALADEEDVV